MRKNKVQEQRKDVRILTLDDDNLMTVTLQTYFSSSGYDVDVANDPVKAVEQVRQGNYDILLLDFLMNPICGDEVVRRIREFNSDLYIILLTGHKNMAPPIQTIRELDIQGYYEKNERFDQLELLVESCVKLIRQNRTIRLYRDVLDRLVENSPRLFRLRSPQTLVNEAARYAGTLFGAENAAVCCLNGEETYFAGIGDMYDMRQAAEAALLEAMTGGVAYMGPDVSVVPLCTENMQAFGLIAARLGEGEQSALFAMYARQVASAFANSTLHAVVNEKNRELDKGFFEIIKALRGIVDARDGYTRGHSDRVSYYAAALAKRMGRDDEFIKRVRMSGLFHDVGKIAVPDEILFKDSRLTSEEYEQMKLHPLRGGEILGVISRMEPIIPIVAAHHERFDGKGYPAGLSGEAIPEEARMICVADAFDAMTSDRRYRRSLAVEHAIEQLRIGAGTQFDAEMAKSFVDMVLSRPELRDEAEQASANAEDDL